MSGRAVLVLDGTNAHDVFELVDIDAGVVRVRSPMWFEIGEELRIRIEQDGDAEAMATTARVRAHVGPVDDRVTELELLDGKE